MDDDRSETGLMHSGLWLVFILQLVVFLTVFWAASAHAAPNPDPHIPDIRSDYCPGGGAGIVSWIAYCDGIPYPDGTYWHYIQYGAPIVGRPAGALSPGMQCVINLGGPVPAPAPIGGCGGAVR